MTARLGEAVAEVPLGFLGRLASITSMEASGDDLGLVRTCGRPKMPSAVGWLVAGSGDHAPFVLIRIDAVGGTRDRPRGRSRQPPLPKRF
jgi:hypothetical protein